MQCDYHNENNQKTPKNSVIAKTACDPPPPPPLSHPHSTADLLPHSEEFYFLRSISVS